MWCGAASAVTGRPSSLARRTRSTEPAVDRCRKCTGAPVRRDERDVAGHHGLLGRGRDAGEAEPARPGPLVHGAAGGQAVVLAVLGQRDAEALGVVEGPPHERAVLHAGAVVGEERDAERGQLAQRGQRLAGPPDGDGAGHRHLGRAARAERQHLRAPRRPSRSPAPCWAWPRSPCSRRARRPGRRSRSSRPPRGRAGAGGCAGRPGPGRPGSRRRRAPARRRARRWTRRRRRSRLPPTATSPAGQAVGPDDRAAADDEGGLRQRPAPPPMAGQLAARGAGTGWPCARRRRWPPAG